ncbi:MAG: hypothetical protein RSC90_04995, partial [Clostridia bacterium]
MADDRAAQNAKAQKERMLWLLQRLRRLRESPERRQKNLKNAAPTIWSGRRFCPLSEALPRRPSAPCRRRALPPLRAKFDRFWRGNRMRTCAASTSFLTCVGYTKRIMWRRGKRSIYEKHHRNSRG